MTKKNEDPLWLQFEKAVFEFIQKHVPSGTVFFNHKVRDKDTGKSRQCDAWIDTTIGEHWPISILVSCKRHGRPLDVGHIGAFVNEIQSTGASLGVIYSFRGFTKPAIAKAEANGIACCRLFLNEPAEMPEELFLHAYICKPTFHICLLEKSGVLNIQTWGDLFDLKIGEHLIVDHIEHTFHEQEEESVRKSNETGEFPRDWAVEVSYKELQLILKIECRWKIYQYESNLNFLDGSFSFSNRHFLGKLSTPAFNAVEAHPGDGWGEVLPSEIVLSRNRVIFTSYKGRIKDNLLEFIAEFPLAFC